MKQIDSIIEAIAASLGCKVITHLFPGLPDCTIEPSIEIDFSNDQGTFCTWRGQHSLNEIKGRILYEYTKIHTKEIKFGDAFYKFNTEKLIFERMLPLPDLKPCVYYNCRAEVDFAYIEIDHKVYYTNCRVCNATGPYKATKELAIEAHNQLYNKIAVAEKVHGSHSEFLNWTIVPCCNKESPDTKRNVMGFAEGSHFPATGTIEQREELLGKIR